MKIKTAGLYVRMFADAFFWSALTFFTYNADWHKTAILFGVISFVVMLWEIVVIIKIHKHNKEQDKDPGADWDEEAWAEFHREMSEHKDYDDRQDSSHFEA